MEKNIYKEDSVLTNIDSTLVKKREKKETGVRFEVLLNLKNMVF